MSGSGYACVGHLFEIANRHSSLSNKNILRDLVEQLPTNLGDSSFNRVEFADFEMFFHEIEVSVESGSKYISGALKLPTIDNAAFELEVERITWSFIMSDYGYHLPYSKKDNDQEQLCFQLFCIFNRLCETTMIPMRLGNDTKTFLFRKFGLPYLANKCEQTVTFGQFCKQLCKSKDSFTRINVKKAYDEYVKHILKEGYISFRPKTFCPRSGKNKYKSGKSKSLLERNR